MEGTHQKRVYRRKEHRFDTSRLVWVRDQRESPERRKRWKKCRHYQDELESGKAEGAEAHLGGSSLRGLPAHLRTCGGLSTCKCNYQSLPDPHTGAHTHLCESSRLQREKLLDLKLFQALRETYHEKCVKRERLTVISCDINLESSSFPCTFSGPVDILDT